MSATRRRLSIIALCAALVALVLVLVGFSSVALATSVQISGTITYQNGQPADGSTITILDSSTKAEVIPETVVHASYLVSVEQGIYDIVIKAPPSSGLQGTTLLQTPVSASRVIDCVLVPADILTLSGTIHDAGGEPVVGVQVALAGATSTYRSTATNALGHYDMELAPGDYQQVQVYGNCSPSTYMSLLDSIPLSIQQNTERDLVLPVYDLTVMVVDSQGTPVSGVQVGHSNDWESSMTIDGLTWNGGLMDSGVTEDGIVRLKALPTTSQPLPVSAQPPADSPFIATTSAVELSESETVVLALQFGRPITVFTLLGEVEVGVGDSVAVGGWFTTLSTGPFSATVDYDDGSGPQTLPLNADKTFGLSHAYGDPGTHEVTVRVEDQDGTVGLGTLSVTVLSPVPSGPPTADAKTLTLAQGGSGTVAPTGSDPDGDVLTFSLAGQPGHGTVVVNADGSFTYTPAGGYVGLDSFTYTASDGKLTSLPATVSITVSPAIDLSGAKIAAIPNQTYTGSPLAPALTVTLKGKTLVNGADYAAAYPDNLKVGTATATVTGIGSYVGTKSATFKIVAAKLNAAAITPIPDRTYTGSAITPALEVTYSGHRLNPNTDYVFAYSNNVDAGGAKATITGIGGYTGTKSASFKIVPADISGATIDPISGQTYTGSPLTPAPTVTWNETTLVPSTNYKVAYSGNTNAGSATVTITGKGNFTGTNQTTFAISPASISGASVAAVADQAYTGSALTPSLAVTWNGKTLKSGTAYTAIYSNNVSLGTATVNITGINNFAGSVTTTFAVVPAKLTGVKSKAGTAAGTVLVSWSQTDGGVTGYEVDSATSSDGTYTSAGQTSQLSMAVATLTSGKTYYFEVRAYVVIAGTAYYGAWSKVVSATAK